MSGDGRGEKYFLKKMEGNLELFVKHNRSDG